MPNSYWRWWIYLECCVTVIFSSIDEILVRFFTTEKLLFIFSKYFCHIFVNKCCLLLITPIHFEVRVSNLGVLIWISSMLFGAGFLRRVVLTVREKGLAYLVSFSFPRNLSLTSSTYLLLYVHHLIFKKHHFFSVYLSAPHFFPRGTTSLRLSLPGHYTFMPFFLTQFCEL